MIDHKRPWLGWIRICGWLALWLLAAAGLQAAGPRKVRVAVFPFLPGIFMDSDGHARGFFVDMLEESARQAHWELEFVPGTWTEGLERVQRNEVDLLTSVAYTPERDRFLDYGGVPAFTVWSLLYAHPQAGIQTIFDVRDRKVGVMRSDMNGAHFRELCRSFNIPCTFEEFATFPEVLQAVAARQVDAGVTVSSFGYAKERDYRVVRTPVVFNPFNIYFATAEGKNADLLQVLDAYLKEGRQRPDSSYHQAINRWQGGAMRRDVPGWVFKAGVIVLGLLLVSWGLVIVVRRQVSQGTRTIRMLNEGLQRELDERQRKQEIILNLASGVSAATGDSFFLDLVTYLARATHADIAMVGELDPKGAESWVRTLALSVDGALVENVSYPLPGSPCERVIRGETVVHPDAVQDHFPGAGFLGTCGARSYVGTPLVSSRGVVLGHLAVIGRQPFVDTEEVRSLLQIFSARAAAELERRRGEAERLAFEMQMQHAQKLESLGVLAGGIAHDFNNLLTAMLGHLNVAQVKVPQESPAQPHLEKLEQIIHRTAGLTRQMLAYSGRGHFVVKPQDLNQILREMVHLLEVSIPKKIRLQLDLAAEVPAMNADGAQIQQVVMNLVTNAADAIGDRDGVIRIATAVRVLDSLSLHALFQTPGMDPGTHVLLEVSDNGCGMSPEVQARIFDPFFTTKTTGRGLGLSAILGILRSHRAGMKIYSEIGHGTTFKLFFPCGGGPVEAEEASGDAYLASEPARILLVDDEEAIRDAGKALLESLGYQVVLAQDGQDALDRIGQAPPEIDAVVMDLMMPRMDGREAFGVFCQRYPGLPVILSSGYNEQESIQDLQGHNLAGFVQKPYTRRMLGQALHAVLRRRSRG